jgi:hypothetical protein
MVIANGNHFRFAIRKLELLGRQWIVEFPFRTEMIERGSICDADLAPFGKVFSVWSHLAAS